MIRRAFRARRISDGSEGGVGRVASMIRRCGLCTDWGRTDLD